MANKKKGKQRTQPQKSKETKKAVTEKKREFGEGTMILLAFAGSLLVYLIMYLIYM